MNMAKDPGVKWGNFLGGSGGGAPELGSALVNQWWSLIVPAGPGLGQVEPVMTWTPSLILAPVGLWLNRSRWTENDGHNLLNDPRADRTGNRT